MMESEMMCVVTWDELMVMGVVVNVWYVVNKLLP